MLKKWQISGIQPLARFRLFKICISVFLQFSLCIRTSVRSVNFIISKIKDWLTFTGGIYQQLLLVCVLFLFSFAHFIHWWFFIVWFLGFQQSDQKVRRCNCSAGTFSSTVINDLSSLSLAINTIYNNRTVRKILFFSNYATWQQCYFCDFFVLVSVVLRDEMRREKNMEKRKFLVQFSKGERVSVTSLFLKERVSNFCFLASGSSSLSFLSWPRSSTGDSVSVTVLFFWLWTAKSIPNPPNPMIWVWPVPQL